MIQSPLSGTLLLFLTAVGSFCHSGRAEDQRPNVVFILADDLGWSDTSLYGKTDYYQTPNLQRLADLGVTFTRAYSASPLCSPTRASILTGLHPARIGLTSPTCHLPKVSLVAQQGKRANGNVPSIPNSSVTRLDTRYNTLGKAFQAAGYVTGHFGKWHLGHAPYSPLEHGFEIDVPHWPGPGPAGSYVAPWKFPDFDPDTPDEHIEDRMAKEAADFIRKNKDKPFFLNYWMFSVHAPFDAKKKLIEKHQKRLNPKARQRSPTYAAMIESMDDAIGKLMSVLKEQGLAEKTIVVFFSDNGGNMYNLVDGVPATNNFPLKGGKATQYEGGIRVPCTISFPGKFPKGSTSNRLIQSTDFFPTLLALTGIKIEKPVDFDGKSFADELVAPNKTSDDARAIFTYFPHQPKVPDWLPPSVAVHHQNWKLIRVFYGGPKGAHRHLLFDLKADPGESKNLAASHSEIVAKLGKRLDTFLDETNAIVPAKNSNFDFESYDFANEGKGSPRSTGRSAKNATPRPGQLKAKVAGWQPSRHCELSRDNGRLIVRSTGNDPHLSFALKKTLPAGKYRVAISMASSGGGMGQMFWAEKGVAPRFFRDRSTVFIMKHDSRFKEYEVEFSATKPVQAIRIDPGQKPGQVVIKSIQLLGKGEQKWNLLN